MYNAQLDYIASQAEAGNALLIYPDRPLDIGRLEMNRDKIRSVYASGHRKALQMIAEIQEFCR